MDLSVRAYIDRLPTEKIEKFIEQYYADELSEDYTYIIPYLQYVLDQRKNATQ